MPVAQRDPLFAAHRCDHHDRFHRQAPDREGERLERRLVDPLRVVDGHEHRRRLRQRHKKRVERDPHGQGICGLTVVSASALRRRVRLRRGQRCHGVGDRAQELGEAGEGELGLALDALRSQLGQPPCLLPGVVDERGLADAGLAAEDEQPARTGASGRQQRVDALPLDATAYEHRASVRPSSVRVDPKPGDSRSIREVPPSVASAATHGAEEPASAERSPPWLLPPIPSGPAGAAPAGRARS